MTLGYIGSTRTKPGHRDDVVAILTVVRTAWLPETKSTIAEAMPMLTGEFPGRRVEIVGRLGVS